MNHVEKQSRSKNLEQVIMGEMLASSSYIQEWQDYLVSAYPDKEQEIQVKLSALREELAHIKNDNLATTDLGMVSLLFYKFRTHAHSSLEEFDRHLNGVSIDIGANPETEHPHPNEIHISSAFQEGVLHAENFDDLYKTIEKQGHLPYSQGILTAEELIHIIDEYRRGNNEVIRGIPRVAGLRDAVIHLRKIKEGLVK